MFSTARTIKQRFGALKSNHGASLVEYGILVGLVATASITAVLVTGQEVDETLDRVALEMQYVNMGQDYVPEVACRASGTLGVPCENAEDFIPVPNGSGGVILVEAAASVGQSDPSYHWRAAAYNGTTGYAAREDGGKANHNELVTHAIDHPAAEYCEARGLYLPTKLELLEMNDWRTELGLDNTLYHSSSQNANGVYDPNAANWDTNNYHYANVIGSPGALDFSPHDGNYKVRCVK